VRKVDNPKNRFELTELAWDPEHAPLAQLHVHEEQAKSILSQNQSPDVPFRFSVNPYRGCQHACAYCYARPTHEYLGFGAGTDFDREIVVKVNAEELLRRAFASSRWQGELIALSGNTDCYQPLEGRYGLTRALLEVCLEHRNPVAIVTKSTLVTRDIELLQRLSAVTGLTVFVSIGFADEAAARAIEPGAPAPARRFETLRRLAEAGIDTGVGVAPIIPGLNDRDVAEVLARAKEAGARHAFRILLRLPATVKPVFLSRLGETLPLAAERVEHAIRDMRGGGLSEPRFGARMRGRGPRWDAVDELFLLQVKRLGLDTERTSGPPTFQRSGKQLRLF
jgi:DNA repair photolyase